MINREHINYIETITKELIKSLRESALEYKINDNYIFSSPHRARFKRLRVELTKLLLEAEKSIYKG